MPPEEAEELTDSEVSGNESEATVADDVIEVPDNVPALENAVQPVQDRDRRLITLSARFKSYGMN